ncbi:hypothetical protein J9303_01755 [Bacillaceae bacterium Marseille-Q3522]|nr:hypothetical protein [Bacillaceae bacterium Marseille-Q3522]
MSNKEVINTDILRARIANLEYGKITVEQIRKLYIEEIGKEPPTEITVYHSEDIMEIKEGKDSGFDGTVIHFYDPEKGINQSYTITRGSEAGEDNGKGPPLDWLYNGFGIFTGSIRDQYNNAEDFDEIVTQLINKKMSKDIERKLERGEKVRPVKLQKYAIGHSLGGNHAQLLEIMTQSFEDVYVINDAAPTSYQLALIDPDFRLSISDEFNIDPENNTILYSLPPAELKAFAEEYYKDRGKDIHHLTVEEDMLFGVFNLRGFLELGDRKIINMDPKYEGIGEIIGELSDENV